MKKKKRRGAPPGNRNAAGHGAPKGNRNAVGHGAPKGNRNAETHGAYARPEESKFTPEEREQVRRLADIDAIAADLERRRIYLGHRIEEVTQDQAEKYDTNGMDTVESGKRVPVQIFWESKEQRLSKLETQQGRVIRNLLKIFEIKIASADAADRLELEKQRLRLNREKATGIFEMDTEETGI